MGLHSGKCLLKLLGRMVLLSVEVAERVGYMSSAAGSYFATIIENPRKSNTAKTE